MFTKKTPKKADHKAQLLTTAELENLAGGACRICIGRGGSV